jgi:hypothetical protein
MPVMRLLFLIPWPISQIAMRLVRSIILVEFKIPNLLFVGDVQVRGFITWTKDFRFPI